MYTPKRDEALFSQAAGQNLITPKILAKGPWYPNSQHGSSMMGLMARAAEQHPSDIPRLVSRLTVDMMKAAPMTPITTQTKVVRSGKNVEFIDIELLSEGKLFLRGSAMRIRVDQITPDDYFRGIPPYPQLPEEIETDFFDFPGAEEPAYHHAIELRTSEHEGLPVIWFRLTVPLFENETTTPFQRVATACDWTYAVPNIVYRRKHNVTFEDLSFSAINPDTTINYFRDPIGDWVGVKAQASFGEMGSGCVGAQLFDQHGPIGFSSQTVLIRAQGNGPMHTKDEDK